jgi:hypothetical protein
MSRLVINRVGKTYNRLTVLERAGSRNSRAFWRCLCECGNEVIVEGAALTMGHTKSCGCIKGKFHANGFSSSVEYKSWRNARARTINIHDSRYKDYGARGILMCPEWLNSFEAFYADMGPRPEGMTLDRINNDGNYEPRNCRWASIFEQNRNRRPYKRKYT